MTTESILQNKMDAAFDNYLELTAILREDLSALLDTESESQDWRRNYVRVCASLMEGHVSCLREICGVSFDCEAPKINKEETKVLLCEKSFGASDRIKLTLRAAHTLFELHPSPNFGDSNWSNAKNFLEKRDSIMHPKKCADLEISEDQWPELHEGSIWIITQFFNFISALQKKHSR